MLLLAGACAGAQVVQRGNSPGDAPAAATQLTQARALFQAGNWSGAESLLRHLLEAEPEAVAPNYLLAHTLFHEDKPKDSLAAFTTAARLHTPSAEDLRVVALDYVLLHDFQDADHWITRSLEADPREGESWYTLGRVRYTENRFGDAVLSFQRALALMPHSVKVENNLGLAYEGLNQPDRAMACYRQAIAWGAGSPNPSAEPLINLGILLTDHNQLEEARTLLQQAESTGTRDARVHGALGRLYARMNALPAAQSELEQAIAADPKNSGLHFQLGQVLRKEGRTAQAAVELQESAALEKAARE